MWGLPLFDIKDPAAILFEVNMARKAKPNFYIKVACFDNTRGTSHLFFHLLYSVLRMSLV